MSYQTIQLEKDGRYAQLTLNRPEAMNAMDEVMMKELADVFEQLQGDQTVQVLVLHGAGKAFSAGGDIKKMVDPTGNFDMTEAMHHVSNLARSLYRLPQITIATVHGAAAGLGFSLILGCDVIVAEEESKLAMNFIGIGLVPDGGGHFFLKERVGTAQAKKMIWQGETMTAEKAQSFGLVDELVPKGEGLDAAKAYAKRLLASPIQAMLASKEILHARGIQALDEILQLESTFQPKMRETKDHQEGIQAFVEKRRPVFTGK